MCRTVRALLSQLRWMSDAAEIPRLAVHVPCKQRFTRYSFYTLCDVFLCAIGGFYTEKLYSQSKHRSKKVTHTAESQFTSSKACSAVTKLNSCSVDTLTSLIFPNEEELSCNPAEQEGLSGQADTALCAERHFGNQTPGLVIPSGPDLLSASQSQHMSDLPELGKVTMALAASGYADCISFFSKFHF